MLHALLLFATGCGLLWGLPPSETVAEAPAQDGVRVASVRVATPEYCPTLVREVPDEPEIDFQALNAARKQKTEAARTRMMASTPVEIDALVSAMGSAGFGMGELESGERAWTIGSTLTHWRRGPEDIVTKPIYLRSETPLSHEALREQMAKLPADGVVRLRVRLDPQSLTDPDADRVEGLLIEVIDAPADADLTALSARLTGPVSLTDPELGTLTLNRSLDRYEGPRSLGDGRYELSVACSTCDDASTVITPETRRRIRCVEAAIPIIAGFVADDLQGDAWTPVSRAQFMTAIRLESIGFGDGLITFYFDDGGLFHGHVITTSIDTETNEVWEATIAG